MEEDKNTQFENRIRFVARHYQDGALDNNAAWKRFSDSHPVKRQIPLRRYFMSTAAVLLLLIAAGTYLIWEKDQPEWINIIASEGKPTTVFLADSTEITLSPFSEIRYDAKKYGKKMTRDIFLTGKAWFNVARDENMTFTVATQLAEVSVLGTSFLLTDNGSKAEITVYTGKVSFVAGKEEETILTAGMSAKFVAEDEEVNIESDSNANNLSWKTRQLKFNQTPLDVVMRDLSECYDVEIVNEGPVKEVELTASFNDMPLEDVLMIINQTLDVDLKKQ